MRGLLEGFPDLKIGGLLPHPYPTEEKVTVTETQEWTVVVFSQGQGHRRKVIRPDPTFIERETGPITPVAAQYARCGVLH